jgi:hypothetical protein
MRKLKLLIASCALFGGTLTSWAQSWIGNEPQEGTFLLYNVAADKFINNGDPKEEWGTNAYLQKGFGLDMKFELKDGAYNLNTNVSNGGDNHYLATSTWCDGGSTPWTFTAVEGQDKTYTISNGDSYLVANDALDDVVYGAKTEDSISTISLGDYTGFDLENATTLNFKDVKVTGNNYVVNGTNTNAVISVDANSEIAGNISSAGTLTNAGTISGEVTLTSGTFTNDGKVTGNLTNAGTTTSKAQDLNTITNTVS